ncbi:hypothetical protein H1215_18700 [Anoxybacillus sp. LAT_38]|uniref:hypothetical protein n=1 Tax=Anoxybacillus sp. LAT_26 TaxID=2862719 RepID=UPI001EEAF383|nr:hypothetical protein [Anoxybacillus sp. LAT_26]MCG6183303.1 hypothetical protein [Anoxybacillus sp. LAT_26]MCG6199196.1 hypothetical protein [Anoxybacillus sp. LAT_38]
MNVQITLSNGEKSARLKIENFPIESFERLLNKTLDFLGLLDHGSKKKKVSIKPKIEIKNFKTAEIKMKPTEDVLSLLPEQLRNWYQEQEQKAAQEGKPTFHLTGIKVKDGMPHYKVFYECPNCGFKGVRYEKEGVKEVQCYQCAAPVDVFPTKGEFPKRDKFNNYFTSAREE